MAHESGPQVYARVAALMPDVAVLYISGYTGESVLATGPPRGGRGVPAEAVHAEGAGVEVREVLDDRRARPHRLIDVVCYTLRALMPTVDPVEIPNRSLFRQPEVCEIAKVQPYVLRTWEAEFPDLGVAKTARRPARVSPRRTSSGCCG